MANQVKKLKLIPQWKRAWRFASVLFSSLGMVLVSAVEHLGWALNSLPTAMQDKIPHASTIALIFFGLAIVGRFFKWEDKENEDH